LELDTPYKQVITRYFRPKSRQQRFYKLKKYHMWERAFRI